MKWRFLLLMTFLFSQLISFAENEKSKAQFIAHFTNKKYVDWESLGDTFHIAIAKNKALYDELMKHKEDVFYFKQETVNLVFLENTKKISGYNVIYINNKDYKDITSIQNRLRNENCIVIGENYPFKSVMVNFIDQGGETIFEINEDMFDGKNVQVTNKLLRKRAKSEKEWVGLLAITEKELSEKEAALERKERDLAAKHEALEKTADSLLHTSQELKLTTDSLTYSQLLIQQKEERLANEKKLRIVFIVIIALSLGLIGFIVNVYLTKKKHAEKLATLNDEITHKNQELEQRNREIMDSIRYAQHIQEAILPTDKIVKQHLEQSFIIFKPKDIVSGDFYWMETVNNKVLYAAVDCTGHGVPGAFVSIVGYDGLNRALREFKLTQPSKIMDKLNEFVDETFEKSEREVKDGMDMGLCVLDTSSNKLEFAGANNPLYFIRSKDNGPLTENGSEIEPTLDSPSHNLYEIKADKQPVGKYTNRQPFTNHSFDIKQGDTFYTFSDGYADQFGGPKGKKFKYKPFKELLLGIQHKTMEEQRQIISETFEVWKEQPELPGEGIEQIDDVVVMGVRI